jgi:hypothetical protein
MDMDQVLDRVPGGAAEHLVHIRDQRAGPEAVALGDLDDRLRELARIIERRQERTRAELHVHHQCVEPGGELLGEDRGDDQRQRLDRPGGVANRVEPTVGGRERAGLADDRAADAGHHRAEQLRRRCDVVAGDRLELVEGAAGVTEAAAGDHRHGASAGREDRGQRQADLVADTSGRVLVDHRSVEPRRRVVLAVPAEHFARAHHRPGQCDPLVPAHAAQQDRHRQRTDLRVADRAVGDPGDQLLELSP